MHIPLYFPLVIIIVILILTLIVILLRPPPPGRWRVVQTFAVPNSPQLPLLELGIWSFVGAWSLGLGISEMLRLCAGLLRLMLRV
jgi:hypothetical protein